MLDSVEAGTYQQRGLGLTGPVGCGKTSLLVTAYKLAFRPSGTDYPAVPASTIQFVSVLDMVDLRREPLRRGQAHGGTTVRSAL